uniref:Uncharacterized protein n=1 Tax=Anopheles farauti TaxID=69004 RepID=A0A182QUP4_9DIPT
MSISYRAPLGNRWEGDCVRLLAQLQCDGKQHQHLVQPRHGALCLTRVELHRALKVGQLVRDKNQLVALNVETDRQIFRQGFHVATLHQLVDRFLARDDERGPASLQRSENVAQDVQHLVRRLEVIRTVHVVDVVDRLLEMVGRILHLLDLPRIVLGDGGALDLLLLTLHLEVNVLSRNRKSMGTLHEDHVQLFQHRMYFLVQYPLEFHLL